MLSTKKCHSRKNDGMNSSEKFAKSPTAFATLTPSSQRVPTRLISHQPPPPPALPQKHGQHQLVPPRTTRRIHPNHPPSLRLPAILLHCPLSPLATATEHKIQPSRQLPLDLLCSGLPHRCRACAAGLDASSQCWWQLVA